MPIQSAKPEDVNALDNAIPPPTSKRTPQGILFAVLQSQALFPLLIGIINNNKAPNNPIEVSFILILK